MSEIEKAILASLATNPMISQQQLASQLGLSRESVAGYISRLTRKGSILGKGYILPQARTFAVVGGANVDIGGRSQASYQAGDSNPGYVNQSAGGVGRNIAENLARLGNETAMITLLGNDSRGQYLLNQSAEAGLNMQDVIQHPSHATSTYIAMHNERGELVGAIADMSIMAEFTPELLATKMPLLHSASTLVVDANLPAQTISWLAEQPLHACIAADAVSATKAVNLMPLLDKIKVLKVNRAEALALLGRSHDADSNSETLIRELQQLGVENVLLSLSQDGVMLGTPTQTIHRHVPTCDLTNDSGAGDALLAGYLHARWHIDEPEDQITFAVACAAATLEAPQAVHSSLTERYVRKRFADYFQSCAMSIA
jgi:pseudouridine kinase